MNIYPFIEAEKACRRNVKRACELLKVSRAAFYQHLAGPSCRQEQVAELAQQIRSVRSSSPQRRERVANLDQLETGPCCDAQPWTPELRSEVRSCRRVQ